MENKIPNLIQVEDVIFKNINFGTWVMRVSIIGTGFEQRALPIVVKIGDKWLNSILPMPENSGVIGFLSEIPKIGDKVRVGYLDSPLMETTFTYQLKGNKLPFKD